MKRQNLPKYVNYQNWRAHTQYRAFVYVASGDQRHVGYYATVKEAVEARDEYCRKHGLEVPTD